LIDDQKRDGLIDAAKLQSRALTKRRWGIFRPRLPLNPDPFWDFVRKNARELDEFPYSGYLFCDMELLTPSALSSDDEVGKRLFEITDSTFVSYQPSDAARTISILDAADLSDEAVERFLRGEGRGDEYPAIAVPLRDAVNHFRQWLRSVSEGKTGVLNIG